MLVFVVSDFSRDMAQEIVDLIRESRAGI